MTNMTKLQTLENNLRTALGEQIDSLSLALGELTLVVSAQNYLSTCLALRDEAGLKFDTLIDLCGMDYQNFADETAPADKRFAAVLHLLSVEHNWRVRVRVYAGDEAFPVLPSVIDVWPAANWFEREAFDLYGIVFDGHNDLRRILTDYGFVGHPFRKDFPVTGYVEMRYDAEQKRVIYQPVTIDPREITPRIIREENYGGNK